MKFNPKKRNFEDLVDAQIQATELSKDGNYYAIMEDGNEYFILEFETLHNMDDFIFVYQNGQQIK